MRSPPWRAITRRDLDLVLAVAISLVLAAIILAVPSAKAARIILGLPFVLFVPGYTLIAALFPRKDDLDPIERVALSLGLSIAIVPLIGLALNYSPWGIRLNPILAFVTLFIIVAAVAALLRRRMMPEEEAFGIAIDAQLPRWSQVRLADRLLALGMVLALVALGLAAFFVATSRGSAERFTEFYVLGSGGKAENYPSLVTVGENATVILGVVNQEGEDTTYRIAVMIDGEETDSIDSLVLADGKRWESEVAIFPANAGENQKVEFLLYRDGVTEPYRSLHLFLDVVDAMTGGVAEAVSPPEAEPSPTPFPEPTSADAASSAGAEGELLTHVVQPDDTLAALAERFGLSPEEIAAVNGLDESEPLPVGEELVIPAVVYVVQSGDLLFDIATAFDVPLDIIIAVNGIEDRGEINPGQELVIPGG